MAKLQLIAKSQMRPTKIYRSSEQGVALIVVLLFLVLIMLAGVMAVRQSNTDLKTATSDQINTLLLQSSDSANQKLETMVNGKTNSVEYRDAMSIVGVFGHFILNPNNQGNEYVYCFNPRNKKYLTEFATIRAGTGFWSGLNNGVCDYKKDDGYTSARQTVMTQVSVTTTPRNPSEESFGHVVIGKEIENSSSRKYQFDIRATSVLPAYNEPKTAGKDCLAETSIPGASGIPSLKCLQSANTPNKMLYEQANVANESTATTCVAFGVGSGLNNKCLLASP